jgi:hypothetical protein
VSSLKTNACVLERATGRQCLWEKPGLYQPCNFQFLGGAAFRFQLLSDSAALRLQRPADVVESHQRKRVAVDVLETREHAAPNRRLLGGRGVRMRLDPPQARRIAKMNPALVPFAVLGDDIFGEKNDRRGPADEFVVLRIGSGRDQPEHRSSVGRGNRHQAVTGLKTSIESQMESKLIQVEIQAAILIANKNVDGVNTQVRVLPVQANGGSGAAHGGNYRPAGFRLDKGS